MAFAMNNKQENMRKLVQKIDDLEIEIKYEIIESKVEINYDN